jgi:hypothetical protein
MRWAVIVTVYLLDTAKGFGFWLRHVGVRSTGTALFLFSVHQQI